MNCNLKDLARLNAEQNEYCEKKLDFNLLLDLTSNSEKQCEILENALGYRQIFGDCREMDEYQLVDYTVK